MNKPRKMTPDKLEKALRLRETGATLRDVAQALGCSIDCVRYHFSPEYRQRRDTERTLTRALGAWQRPVIAESQVRREEVLQALRRIPHDTRDLTQRICGDPLPGRSALDMRGGA